MLLLYFRPVTEKKTPPLRNHSICSGPRRFTFAFNYSASVFPFVQHPFPIGRLPGSRQSPGRRDPARTRLAQEALPFRNERGAAPDWNSSGSPGTRGRDVWKQLLEIDVNFSFAFELKFKQSLTKLVFKCCLKTKKALRKRRLSSERTWELEESLDKQAPPTPTPTPPS